MAALIRAELAAWVGNATLSKQELQQGLGGFTSLGISEGLNFEFAGRVFRMLGDFEQGEKHILQGIRISAEFPMSLAALYFELAKLLTKTRRSAAEIQDAKEKAISIYNDCESPLRVQLVQKFFETEI